MTQLESGLNISQEPLRKFGLLATILCGSFVGGAAVGVVVLALVMALFAMVTFGWGIVLFSDQGVEILMLGGLAGGVTGVIVGLLATLARRFRDDEPAPNPAEPA